MEPERELSNFDELEILMRARLAGVDPELLRYYVKFGPGAPTPPQGPPWWKAWWWRLTALFPFSQAVLEALRPHEKGCTCPRAVWHHIGRLRRL